MGDKAENDFVEQYEAFGPIRLIARRLYRERYPKGMRHNGPMRVDVDVSTLQYLLERWKLPSSAPAAGGE